jgi:NAD(P)-dependent dehydrogenase (short-subunit alcohol dehydrogenase family)
MSTTFSGQVALVTGGPTGIGRMTAEAFAREGLNVVVADIDKNGEEETVAAIKAAGGDALFVSCDVTKESDVQSLIKTICNTYGSVEYAFNNAGIDIEKGELNNGTEDEFDRIMAVNVKGIWLCMKHQISQMISQGVGAIVNTLSIGGLGAAPNMSIYCASKHAVIGLTKSAAVENARKGIRINAVCPGVIDTNMFNRSRMFDRLEVSDSETRARVNAIHPMDRIGTAEEIADAVLYLCSDGASFITGHTLSVDGGLNAK